MPRIRVSLRTLLLMMAVLPLVAYWAYNDLLRFPRPIVTSAPDGGYFVTYDPQIPPMYSVPERPGMFPRYHLRDFTAKTVALLLCTLLCYCVMKSKGRR